MAFRLPPGTGGRYGGGGLTQLGWTRHDWGAFHYWVSLILVGLILLHLILHWRWVWAMIAGPASTGAGKDLQPRVKAQPVAPRVIAPPSEKPNEREPAGSGAPRAGRAAPGLHRPLRIVSSLAVVLLLLLILASPWLIPVRGEVSGSGRRGPRGASALTREESMSADPSAGTSGAESTAASDSRAAPEPTPSPSGQRRGGRRSAP
jgi:hypothetical protein